MAEGVASLDDASDVTHSTAFLVLNTLVDEGQITEERADYLKQKFKDLHNRVLVIYKRDNLLLKRARQLRTELDTERQRVQARGEIARRDDSEIQKLKETLMENQKSLMEAQERESVLQVEALEYDRRKQNLLLEREDAMAAEEARLRPKMEGLQKEIEEMGTQTKELMEKHEELKRTHERLSKEEETCKSEIANFSSVLAQTKQQFTNIEREPDRAKKQLQLVVVNHTGATRELAALDEKVNAQGALLTKLEAQQTNWTNDLAKTKQQQQSIRADIEAKRKTLATLNTSLEVELETRQSYQDRLSELERLIKATRIAQQQEVDNLNRIEREKEKAQKEFVACEQTRENVEHEHQSFKEQLNVIEKEIAYSQKQRADLVKQILASKKDIEARTKRLLKEQSKEKDFVKRSTAVLEDIGDVEEMMVEKKKQEEVKRKELAAMIGQRQNANRDCARENSRLVMIKNEVRTKEIQHKEIVRRQEELEKRLTSLIDQFHNIKRERSLKAAQIQAITQKMTEVAEKTKILENELEVLLREAALKEKEMLKKKRQTHEVTQVCSNLRLERNKYRKRLELAVDAEKEVRAHVKRMNAEIASIEDTMEGLRNAYEEAVESRNQTGIQLIDRNDELGLLLEKVKAQEVALQQGVSMTNARGEEVRGLKTKLADLYRQLEVCQRSVPKVRQLEEELARLASEIEDERWRTETLEKDITDPSNTQRYREVKAVGSTSSAAAATGSAVPQVSAPAPSSAASNLEADTSTEELAGAGAGVGGSANRVGGPSEQYVALRARCQDLEARVNTINEKLREKELILAEVTELSDNIAGQADADKEVTLALAKQVNQQQSSIRNKTRQMMATISELSLFQASSIQLQQEVERLESVVEEAERRLAEGEAPFIEAEEEYLREKESSHRYTEMLRRRRAEDAEAAAINTANVVATTAEARPNAYVPDGELGVPKPYGNHAPFRPTLPAAALGGASNRFIAKRNYTPVSAVVPSHSDRTTFSSSAPMRTIPLLATRGTSFSPSGTSSARDAKEQDEQLRLSDRRLDSTH